MSRFVSKLWIGRLCLMSFILFDIMFMINNAFSQQHWHKDNLVVIYDLNKEFITFNFLFYEYPGETCDAQCYLDFCDFYYSEDGKQNILLMRSETKEQKKKNWTWIKMSCKKPREKIQLLNCNNPNEGVYWTDVNKYLKSAVTVTNNTYKNGHKLVKSKRSYLGVKWYLQESCKGVKFIKIRGKWRIGPEYIDEIINEVYPLEDVKLKSNSLQNGPSALKLEICDNFKVSGETDAIIVIGAELGKNIKVYTTTGATVKSVVANEDVVSIKLPKNQIYIVHIGKSRYKVAL